MVPYRRRSALAAGETVGLFANGFPDSVAFLEHIGAALTRAIPGLDVKLWNKGNASALASQQQLGEIQAECTRGRRRVRPLRQLHIRHRA